MKRKVPFLDQNGAVIGTADITLKDESVAKVLVADCVSAGYMFTSGAKDAIKPESADRRIHIVRKGG